MTQLFIIHDFLYNNTLNFFLYLEYAQVTKMLGNGRLEAMCFDGVKRLCHIRGKLRKKVLNFNKYGKYISNISPSQATRVLLTR